MEKNGIFYPSDAHMAARTKKRRLMWQLDALGEAIMRGMRPDIYEKFIFGYIDQGNTQLDGIYWDFLLAGDFYAMYDSKLLPKRKCELFAPWWETGFDMVGTLTKGAKERGLESILVHRISEVDVLSSEFSYEEKYAHPDRIIPTKWYHDFSINIGQQNAGNLNMAHPEVQKRKLAILEELLTNYEFDGLEIDLCRHTPFLPEGKEWEYRAYLVEFFASLRRMLDRLEQEKGHPFLLSVRTGESPALIKFDGVDIETLLARNILDSITAGGRSFSPDLEGYRALIEKYHGRQQLYPTIDYHHASDAYACPPIEVWRGVCADCYARSADGIKLFNWWTASTEQRRVASIALNKPDMMDFAPNCQDQAVYELGDKSFLARADKTHVAERRYGYPWCSGYSNDNRLAQLPLLISSEGTVLLYCSDTQENLHTSCEIELVMVFSDAQNASVSVFINQTELNCKEMLLHHRDAMIPPKGKVLISGYRPDRLVAESDLQKYTYPVSCDDVRTGWNTVYVKVSQSVQIERCELQIKYC